MIKLSELYVLRHGIEKGVLTKKEILPFLERAKEKGQSLIQMLLEDQRLSFSQWKKWSQQASYREDWPNGPQNLLRENQYLYEQLASSGEISLEELERHLSYCRQAIQRGKPLRLFQSLIRQKVISPSQIAQILKIQTNLLFNCPQCQISWLVDPYYPWADYPCPFCSSSLEVQKASASQMETKGNLKEHLTSAGLYRENRAVGQRFGKFTIEKKLGEGGMGSVYKGRNVESNQIVALKVISKSQPSEEQIRRFQREANVVSQLSHPHIVPLYDFGQINGVYYFTMGYIEGRDLRSLVEEKEKLSVKKTLQLAKKICQAVIYAHGQEVLHRDIKPGNIMIDKKGEPHLMDFGLAKRAGGGATRLTKTGAIVGSPEFMAPEQVVGKRLVSFGADIYALGGLFYYMLSGRPCFRASTAVKLLFKVTQEEPLPLSELNPTVSPELEVVIHKCLAKSEEDRYQSVDSLLNDLEAISEGRSIKARAPGVFQKIKSWQKRHRKGLVGLAMGVLLSLIFVFLLIIAFSPPSGQNNSDRDRKKGSLEKNDGQWQKKMEDLLASQREEKFKVASPEWNRRRNLLANIKDPGSTDALIGFLSKEDKILSRLVLEVLFFRRHSLTSQQVTEIQKKIWHHLQKPVKVESIDEEVFFVNWLEIWPQGQGRQWARERQNEWQRAILAAWKEARQEGRYEKMALAHRISHQRGTSAFKDKMDFLREELVEELKKKAHKLVKKNKLAPLAPLAQNMITVYRESGWGHYFLALAKNKNFQKALKALNRFLYYRPRNFWGLLQKGIYLYQLGRNREALEILNFANFANPNNVHLHYWRHQLYLKLGEYYKAYFDLQKVKNIDPHYLQIKKVNRHLKKLTQHFGKRISQQARSQLKNSKRIESLLKRWSQVRPEQKKNLYRLFARDVEISLHYHKEILTALQKDPPPVVKDALAAFRKAGRLGVPFQARLLYEGDKKRKLLALKSLRKMGPSAFHAVEPLSNYFYAFGVEKKPPQTSPQLETAIFQTVVKLEKEGEHHWKKKMVYIGLGSQHSQSIFKVVNYWKNSSQLAPDISLVKILLPRYSPSVRTAFFPLLAQWATHKPWRILLLLARWEKSQNSREREKAQGWIEKITANLRK